MNKKPQVAIIMGSSSDYPTMKDAELALQELQVEFESQVISAHRTPDEMYEFSKSAHAKGIKVIIAGAGGAAHLPGMVASISPLPVIGVPVQTSTLNGQDSLLSIVQMPKGVPVACVAIGNAYNAGILAAQILSIGDSNLQKRLIDFKENLRKKVLAQTLKS